MAPEPVLVDPGPTSVRAQVLAELRRHGFDPADLRHIAVTHIHLDHAGSAGSWVADNPDLVVHVHEDAGLHLVHPRRLVASTRRTFGEAHDRLWGEVVPVPAHAIRGVRPGPGSDVPGLRPLHTPGHIEQHLAYLDESSGFLAAGDCMGILVSETAPAHPPTPPPTLDVAAWLRTLDELAVVAPESVGVTHFGVHLDPKARMEELRASLLELAARVRAASADGVAEADAEQYQEETVQRLAPHRDEGLVERYFATFSAANDYLGMVRYLDKNPDWSGGS